MNAPIRSTLPPLPARISRLPIDHRGFPVPWFVQWYENGKPSDFGIGKPDFRVIDASKLRVAVRQRLCWVCGGKLGQYLAFTIGPMCAINRVISEPPAHFECAEFSAKACPFLSQPRMRRNEKDLPDGQKGPGFGIKRNPGVACVWVTKSYRTFQAPHGNKGTLFSLGDPTGVNWYAEGRDATRAEVLASIDSGFPALLELAEAQGADAIQALYEYRADIEPLLPTTPISDNPPGVSGPAGERS